MEGSGAEADMMRQRLWEDSLARVSGELLAKVLAVDRGHNNTLVFPRASKME